MTRNTRSQHDHFKIKGHWWLPKVGKKVAGELSYSESDLTLSLYGGLSDVTLKSPFSRKLNEPEHSLIYGETEDNVAVTLLQSFYTKWTPNITTLAVRPESKVDVRTSQLHSRMMVEGLHLPSVEDKFAKCRLELPSLDVWLGVTPFKADMKDSIRRMSLEYTRPDNLHFDVEEPACRVSFVHGVTPPRLPLGQSPTIFHRTFLEIEPSHPHSCKHLLELSSHVVDLLSVVYGSPVVSIHTSLIDPSQDGKFEVFYPRHEIVPKEYGFHDFLIRFSEIEDCFSDVVSQWMNPTVNVKRARQMLISAERRPAAFIELRFLPLAHAIEVLSNEATKTTFVNKADFNIIRKSMLNAIDDDIPKELTNSIMNSLQWANGRSFREKLRSLLSELQQETWQLFASDKEKFLSGVVNTRNHYTHYSAKRGNRILQNNELHWGIEKLALMIRVFVLLRAGVAESVIQTSITKHVRLAQERRVWASITEEGSEFAIDE